MQLVRLVTLALVVTLGLLAGQSRLSADEGQAGNKIAAVLQTAVENHSIAGAVVLVADKDDILCIESAGAADVATDRPMQADSLFWIASQSKPITATALMILVDEGKVKLDDPVEKYLPEFKKVWLAAEQDSERLLLKKPGHPITVRNILSHTSGLPFKSALEEPTLDLLPLVVAARSYAMTPLDFEPDSSYRYSNAGINTAGRIIEVVSGLPYEQFLDERLFKPLAMKDTTFWPNEEQLTRLAKSYRLNAEKNGLEEVDIGQLFYPLNDRRRQPMPAGGLFSTARDVARFCQMVLNGGVRDGKRYLSEVAIKEMTRRQTPPSLKESYGLGWSVGGDGSYGHGGAHATNMSIDPARGLITVFMVQAAGLPDVGKVNGEFSAAAREIYGK
ncbi:MAG TPA: serine hydrolase domain-containing protein [Pirellulales bacterium]|nr:serine hydrolase domain-containing protein [Pirellulales bacterium]